MLIAKSLQMTPETVAMEAASMSEQAASAAEALAQKLKEAANKLQIVRIDKSSTMIPGGLENDKVFRRRKS